MEYICDNYRHLVCKPFSIENLHKMAKDLGIGRHFFHKYNKRGKLRPHYDIPVKRISEIKKRCTVVSQKEIVNIIENENINR